MSIGIFSAVEIPQMQWIPEVVNGKLFKSVISLHPAGIVSNCPSALVRSVLPSTFAETLYLRV